MRFLGIARLAAYGLLLTATLQAVAGPGDEDTCCPTMALCDGDVNGDGAVDPLDAGFVLARLGFDSALDNNCPADLNCDGAIDPLDVGYVQARFGTCDPVEACPLGGGPVGECAPPLEVRSDELCYLAGATAEVHVDVPPYLDGSLHFLFGEDDDGADQPLLDELLVLDGSATHTFSVPLAEEGRYVAVARLLDLKDQDLTTVGLRLGVRPDLPQIPEGICTFEQLTMDAADLLEQIDAAISEDQPVVVEMGTQSFLLELEENTHLLLSEEAQEQVPTVRFFHGRIAAEEESSVRLTFQGVGPDTLAYIRVDPGQEEPAIYLDPAARYGAELPGDLYILYQSADVHIPPFGDDVVEDDIPLPNPPSPSPRGGDPCLRIRVNIYYDSDAAGQFIDAINTADEVFSSQLGLPLDIRLFVLIDTSTYGDTCEDILNSFEVDPNVSLDYANIALLFTTKGTNCGGIAGQNSCTSLVKRHAMVSLGGSAHDHAVALCHELGHLFCLTHDNACLSPSGCGQLCVPWSDDYCYYWGDYSIMHKGGVPGIELVFLSHHITYMNAFFTLVTDFFPCLLELSVIGSGSVHTSPESWDWGDTGCQGEYVPITLTPIPDVGWRFDALTGSRCSGWEATSLGLPCEGCEATFTELYGTTYAPSSLWLDEEVGETVAPQIAWSPDSTLLARSWWDGTSYKLKALDAITGKEQCSFGALEDQCSFGVNMGELRSLAYSPDYTPQDDCLGGRIAAGSEDGTVYIYWMPCGDDSQLLLGHTASVNSVAWSPDSAMLATGSSDRSIRIWEPKGSFLVEKWEIREDWFGGLLGEITSLSWSPDGLVLLATEAGAGNPEDTYVHRFDPITGTAIGGPYKTPCAVASAVAWAPAHRVFVSGCRDGSIRVRDLLDEAYADVAGHTDEIYDIAWNPDVTEFFTVGDDEYFRRWGWSYDEQQGTLAITLLEEGWVWPPDMRTVAWSPNRRFLAIGSETDSTVSVVELYN